MSKPRIKIADFGVYIILRIAVCVIQSLSYQAGCSVAAAFAWLAYGIDKRHREVARDNLRQAFPAQYTEAELNDLVRGIYRHFCSLLIDIIHLPRKLNPHTWRRHLEIPQIREVVDGLISGRPLLLVTGHFGNWEAGGYTLALLGFTTHAIARPIDNRYVDEFLRGFRERTGQKILAKKGDFEQMQAILAGNGLLATLADQDAGQRGLFVDFFGRPASTHKAVALLALEYQVPLMVIGIRKLPGVLHYRLLVEDLILPEDYEGQRGAARAITQRYTAALERVVRAAPEQYFWLHRRWKHAPKKAPAKAAYLLGVRRASCPPR